MSGIPGSEKFDGWIAGGAWPGRNPILLSSPHSGSQYHADFGRFARLRRDELRSLSDGPVERLLHFAGEDGFEFIHARFARAVVDLNRAPDECLPFLLEDRQSRRLNITARARAGLGVVPTHIGVRAIYDSALPADDLNWRIDEIHQGYHSCLANAHAGLAARFGIGLLADIHSMPDSAARANGRGIDIVLSNCHGQSCPDQLLEFSRDCFTRMGLRCAVNQPYAGGYITRHHGKPACRKPALQVELRRSLFMDEAHELKRAAEQLSAQLRCWLAGLGSILHELAGSPPGRAA